MQVTAAVRAIDDGASDPRWRLLALLNLFRVLAAMLLLLLFVIGDAPRIVGEAAPFSFLVTIVLYLSAGLAGALLLALRKPGLAAQSYAQLGIDLVAIVVLTHASGGISSGLANLTIVCVMAASALLSERNALLYAALTSLALLGEQGLGAYRGTVDPDGYQQVAILGAIFFAISLFGSRLARRARETEALAIQRGLDLENLAQLNDYIVQQLQTGVAVVDQDGVLRQLNAAAAGYLGVASSARAIGQPAAEGAPRLAAMLEAYRRESGEDPPSFESADGARVIVPHCLPLGAERRGMVVFLEDSQVVAERMQQLKLAALGRLTASIAHEIRNPLSAVANANQLLEESPTLTPSDRRFTGIISTHVARVNTIVENVLQLSRRGHLRPEALDLPSWLRGYVDEFERSHHLQPAPLSLALPGSPIVVRFDPTHLQQVMWNLLENALRHGIAAQRDGRVEIRCGSIDAGGAWLEVADDGPGIAPEIAEHVFEPFYTGSPRGTGLGLFIARELCAANRAALAYQRGAARGAVFRVTFPDPSRWMT
jgi:two-component system sensor histidine kinase PilS (NtrC family)